MRFGNDMITFEEAAASNMGGGLSEGYAPLYC